MRRLLNNRKNHSNWFSYLTYKYFNKSEQGFTFKCRNGLQVEVPGRMLHTYKECFFDEAYLKGHERQPDPSQALNVVDVGANVGYFSLFMLSRFQKAKVFSFEPMPMNLKLLNAYKEKSPNLDLNVVNQAVSGKPGSITLNYDATDQFTTAASIFDIEDQPDQLEVTCTTLEAILKDHNLSHIDFLKLDCEGSEYGIVYEAPASVLEGITWVAIETHPGKNDNENTQALAAYLRKHNFEINATDSMIWGWKNK